MEIAGTASAQLADNTNAAMKRKRSPSSERPAHPVPPAKTAKTHSSHVSINYLTRQYSDTLPLLTIDDTLPATVQLISDYNEVLNRHESMAGNLGARPLGPILIKSFERLFGGPPKVLKSHGKEGTFVTWLDVVDFARHKPEQFNLEKMRDGVRVCQFYTKQSRVEISEEDYVLITSGMPQKLIPPQPIAEDEEKELGTLEILEKNLGQVIQVADQIVSRARQLSHRLRNRKNAIISRRETEASSASEVGKPQSPSSTTPVQDQVYSNSGEQRSSHSPPSGFVAINSRPAISRESALSQSGQAPALSDYSKTLSSNGKSHFGASVSPSTRAELLSCFKSSRDHLTEQSQSSIYDSPRQGASIPRPQATSKSKAKENTDHAMLPPNSTSPVPIPNTPSSLQHYNKPSPADRFDDSGPYKAEMLSRMDSMQRGDRVLPPCDRCRRLHMDCLKNLTACLGCTKKHAKCSWKEVSDQELIDNPHVPRSKEMTNGIDNYASSTIAIDPATQGVGVRDEELLGEDDSDDGKDEDVFPTEEDSLKHPHVSLRDTSEVPVATGLPAPAAQMSQKTMTKSSHVQPQPPLNESDLLPQPQPDSSTLNHKAASNTSMLTEKYANGTSNKNVRLDTRADDSTLPSNGINTVSSPTKSTESTAWNSVRIHNVDQSGQPGEGIDRSWGQPRTREASTNGG